MLEKVIISLLIALNIFLVYRLYIVLMKKYEKPKALLTFIFVVGGIALVGYYVYNGLSQTELEAPKLSQTLVKNLKAGEHK